MSISVEQRARLIESLRGLSPIHRVVWDDARTRYFTAAEVLEALSGELPEETLRERDYFRDPELGELQARPLQPTPAQRSAGADLLRTLRGEAILDLGSTADLEQLAEDIYNAMNKAFEFRYTTFARLELERREV